MAIVTQASSDSAGIVDAATKIAYPSPFFDIARKYLPLNVKELFTWCNYFYAISSVVHPIVNKLSEYPVTDLVYGDIDPNACKAWKRVLEQSIDIKSLLISTHVDYYVYGNAFLLFHDPFVRYLICTACGKRHQARNIKYKFMQQSGNWHFQGRCDACNNNNAVFKIEDVLVRNRNKAKVTKISPLNMEIEFNEFNEETNYVYKVPQGLKKSIMAGTKIVLDTTDRVVFDAISKNKDVRLDNDKVFHFKRPTLSGLWKGWGTPTLLPVLKDIHYYYILRKANEALALQRIVPLSVLYPSQQGDVSPFQHLNLAGWRGKVEDELGKWRRDCVAEHMLIETNSGFRPANSIKVGDLVKTHKHEFKKVEFVNERNLRENEKVYDLNVYGLPALKYTVSENHKFIISRNSDISTVRAADLKIGDYVTYHINKKIITNQIIDLSVYLPTFPKTDDYIYMEGSQARCIAHEVLCNRTYDGDRKSFCEKYKCHENELKIAQSNIRLGNVPRRMKRHINIDESLAKLIGYYIGDGSSDMNKCAAIAFNKTESWKALEFSGLVQEVFGIECHIYDKKTYDLVQIGNKLFAHLMPALCGRGSENKHIPCFLMEESEPVQRGLLRGLYGSDGNYVKNIYNNYSRNPVARKVYTTCSINLSHQLWNILLRLGFVPRVQSSLINPGEICGVKVRSVKRSYKIIVDNVDDDLSMQKSSDRKKIFINDNVLYSKIKSIETSLYSKKVYGFTINEDHTFTMPFSHSVNSNYVPILPIPMGYQTLFSEARQLMVTQEQDLCAQGIAAGIGVPIEFIRGNLSWSGSSVSLRILENSFLRLRSQDLTFINNHLIPKLSRIYHLPKIEVSFTKFKMADDIQAKTRADQLMQSGFVSRKSVLEQDSYNSDDEIKQMEREHITLNSVKSSDAIAEQELRNILQVMQNRNQIIAQFDGQQLQVELQKAMNTDNRDEVKIKLDDMAEKYALTLMSQDPAMATATLEKMKSDMPNLYVLIMSKIKEFNAAPPVQNPMPVPPQQPVKGEQVNMEVQKPLPEEHMPLRSVGGI